MNGSEQPDSARWYVVHCKQRQDERALENLQRQGFQCYRPMRSVERCRNGGIRTAREPLFPGYVFIRLHRFKDNWAPIGSTRGVHKIVRFDEYPVPVSDELIETIRARLADPLSFEPYLRRGERVRITSGAFSELEGVFVAADGTQRVVILLRILQGEHRLAFPLKQVRKAV